MWSWFGTWKCALRFLFTSEPFQDFSRTFVQECKGLSAYTLIFLNVRTLSLCSQNSLFSIYFGLYVFILISDICIINKQYYRVQWELGLGGAFFFNSIQQLLLHMISVPATSARSQPWVTDFTGISEFLSIQFLPFFAVTTDAWTPLFVFNLMIDSRPNP